MHTSRVITFLSSSGAIVWLFTVFFVIATVIYKTRIARFDLWTPEGPYSFRVLSLVFYKSSKRKSWLSFFENALFGLKKWNQTGS